MRNWFSLPRRPLLHLGIATDGVALLSDAGARGGMTLLAQAPALHAMQEDGLSAQLQQLFGEAAVSAMPVSVVVADAWVRAFVVTPPANAARVADCEAAAAMRFHALYGEPPAEWMLRADWQAAQPFVACAMPRAMLAALQSALALHAHVAVSIVPQFVAVWNRHRAQLPADAWLALHSGEHLTLCAVLQRRIRAVRILPAPAAAMTPDWLQRELQREALRLNCAPPAQLAFYGSPLAGNGTKEQLAMIELMPSRHVAAAWPAAARLACDGDR